MCELGGVAHYNSVFSAYLLTSTITVPMFGKLADLFGRKRTYLWSVAIFLVGSVLCGLAHTFPQLILCRAIQGSAPAACSRSPPPPSSATSTRWRSGDGSRGSSRGSGRRRAWSDRCSAG
jgi:MFS family permease